MDTEKTGNNTIYSHRSITIDVIAFSLFHNYIDVLESKCLLMLFSNYTLNWRGTWKYVIQLMINIKSLEMDRVSIVKINC